MNILLFILIVLILISVILFIKKFLKYNNYELYNTIKSLKYIGDYKIPRILHQTYSSWDKLAPGVKKVIKKNLDMNPTWKYRFYDNQTIDKYIKEHESEYVYNAYKKINPKYGAVISDLFRYIVIYHEGGVYMDIKSKTNIPLDNWVHKDKLLFSLFGDNEEFSQIIISKYFKNCETKIKLQLSQFCLIFPKNFIILRFIIDYIIENIYKYEDNNIKFLGNKIHNIYNIFKLTGPWIYTKILGPYICNNPKDIILFKNDGIKSIFDGNILYDGTNGKYHKDQHSSKKHYLDLNEPIIL